MDPTATLRRFLEAVRVGDRVEAFHALQDLAGWLAKGGFLPDIYVAIREFERADEEDSDS
jgi:hypothetical protein